VVAYAIGVERGKRISAAGAARVTRESSQISGFKEVPEKARVEEAAEVSRQDDKAGGTNGPFSDTGETADLPVPLQEEVTPESGGTTAAPQESVYLIQLVSFRKEKHAREEVKKLKAAGREASFARKGMWYQVYARGYKTAGQARRAKDAFNEEYPDCYIRRQK
ncbi:MAG: SPOR domain-containing protein, partial [Candidatus Omnitrophica bacterium]|nr:SPOR domain-containing protein [Candidatus Omnitrophota bacterium]